MLRLLPIALVILIAMSAPVALSARADDKPEKREQVQELDSQLLDDLSNDLLEGLGDEQAREPATREPGEPSKPSSDAQGEDIKRDNPLLSIGERMRSVEERIAEFDTSGKTQALQNEIVADLESLIEQMKKQCAACKSQSKSGGSAGQGGQAAQQAGNKPARDSTNRVGKAKPDTVDGQQGPDLIKQVWGHLPPRVRDLMRSASIEEFSPQYEQQIEAYYQRLADESNRAATGTP